jgi:hypothetical protein
MSLRGNRSASWRFAKPLAPKSRAGLASSFSLGRCGRREGCVGSGRGEFFHAEDVAVGAALQRGVVRGIERYAEAFETFEAHGGG